MVNIKKLAPILLLAATAAASAADSRSANRYGRMAETMVDMMDAFSSAYQKKRPGGNSSGQTPWSPSSIPGAGNWMQGSTMMSPWSMGSMPMAQSMNPWSMSSMPSMPMSQGLNPWSMGSMPMSQGMSPWSMGNIPWPQGETMIPWNQRGGPGSSTGDGELQAWQERGSPTPPGRYRLSGNWQGPSGEILMVRNDRFRIYLGKEHFKEGTLRILSANQLLMQDPETGIEREYEYALHEGKLALRDAAGNLLLFRRTESQFKQ